MKTRSLLVTVATLALTSLFTLPAQENQNRDQATSARARIDKLMQLLDQDELSDQDRAAAKKSLKQLLAELDSVRSDQNVGAGKAAKKKAIERGESEEKRLDSQQKELAEREADRAKWEEHQAAAHADRAKMEKAMVDYSRSMAAAREQESTNEGDTNSRLKIAEVLQQHGLQQQHSLEHLQTLMEHLKTQEETAGSAQKLEHLARIQEELAKVQAAKQADHESHAGAEEGRRHSDDHLQQLQKKMEYLKSNLQGGDEQRQAYEEVAQRYKELAEKHAAAQGGAKSWEQLDKLKWAGAEDAHNKAMQTWRTQAEKSAQKWRHDSAATDSKNLDDGDVRAMIHELREEMTQIRQLVEEIRRRSTASNANGYWKTGDSGSDKGQNQGQWKTLFGSGGNFGSGLYGTSDSFQGFGSRGQNNFGAYPGFGSGAQKSFGSYPSWPGFSKTGNFGSGAGGNLFGKGTGSTIASESGGGSNFEATGSAATRSLGSGSVSGTNLSGIVNTTAATGVGSGSNLATSGLGGATGLGSTSASGSSAGAESNPSTNSVGGNTAPSGR